MNRRIGFLFAVIPVLLVILAVVRGGWYYIANWPALSFAIVGSGYWHFGPGVFGKRANGTLPIWRIVILAPYLFYSWGMWHLLQMVKRENPFDQLLPDVIIGRRLLASEFPDNVERVLDLTAVFPVPAGIRNRVLYHSFKILDASVPPADDVVECLDQLDQEHGVLYIHCAEGHGRTGLLSAALLLHRGEAASTEEAVNKVKAVRPRVRLNAVQRQCLEAVARQIRNRTTNQQSPTDKDQNTKHKEPSTNMQHDIALIGLAVMGQNLVLNMANHGFSVGVYNRTTQTMQDFVDGLKDESEDKVWEGTAERIAGYAELKELVANLKSPRRVMIMVKAGGPVDAVIEELKPLLDAGDIIIDGGNSEYEDTNRRSKELREAGFQFIGTGVSGGEEGALKGPSIMPGGHKEAWPHVKEILQSISAKVGPNDDIPCCDWVGEDGAGHYVKMVHNGIEYGDMQLICEAYFILKHAIGLTNEELFDVFKEWNEGELASYLIEITRDIFTVKDKETGEHLVDQILDTAKQKGTGKWMSQHALDLGVPTTLITEAVYARCLSAQKDARVRAAEVLSGPEVSFDGDREQFIEDVKQALYASKLCSYAQGYVQLDAAAAEFGWKLNNGAIALLWRGGCIIRSVFLEDIKKAFDKNPDLENLLLDDFFKSAIDKAQPSWRRVVSTAIQLGLPVPAFTAALTYYDGYRQARLPANLLQAQRDYFGAHTYERVDKPRGETFHTDWIRERQL